MKLNNPAGKIYFFKCDKSQNPKDCFSPLLEVNSNFDNLKSLHLGNGKAFGITVNNELLEWEFEKKQISKNQPPQITTDNSDNSSNNPSSKNQNKKNDFYFLISKPSYRFHKMKIKSIKLNKTMCLSLDINGYVLVWGQNKEGLLGLGFDVTSVETPTILENLVDITDISLSDYHAVALNSNGVPFSWGLGKYGELGLERSIYSPIPQQMNTEGLYYRVFCGNLITCFLDFEGHFSYFGVIIRQLGGNSSTITVKNLLNDQNNDTKNIFFEKEIEELEDQKFKEIVIGNGFIGLLGTTGTLFTLEYNDKLTMLYSKYYLYNIVVAKNEIFGLAKDSVKISENPNNLSNNIININNSSMNNGLNNDEKIKTNYYLCKWTSKSSSENEVCSDIWNTTIWKFKEEFTSTIENCKLLDTNENRNILLLLDTDEKFITNLNTSVLNPNKKFLDLSTNNDMSLLDTSLNNNNTTFIDNLMLNLNKKKLPSTILEYEAEFDDTFNLKYKRTKAKSKRLVKDLSYMNTIRSRSLSPFLNKSYNASYQNSVINLNKSNLGNIGNNISAIGLNTSGYVNKKTVLIPTNNNYKKNNSKGNGNNSKNYSNNFSNQFSHINKNNNNFINSKSSLSLNNNDLSKDNNDMDNNLSNIHNISANNINNFSSSLNNNTLRKDKDKDDNVNIYDESIDVKERELNKYRSEIDDIIANYKNKQNIKKTNLMSKYGIAKENNININMNKNNANDNPVNNNENNNIINNIENENENNDSMHNIENENENNNKQSEINNKKNKDKNNDRIKNKKNLFIKSDSYNESNFENITPINTNNSMKNDDLFKSEKENYEEFNFYQNNHKLDSNGINFDINNANQDNSNEKENKSNNYNNNATKFSSYKKKSNSNKNLNYNDDNLESNKTDRRENKIFTETEINNSNNIYKKRLNESNRLPNNSIKYSHYNNKKNSKESESNKNNNTKIITNSQIKSNRDNEYKMNLSKKLDEINKEIMNNIQSYFQSNKNSVYKKRKRRKRNKLDNEIEFNMNRQDRQETFQDIYNNNNNNEFQNENNSFTISPINNLFLPDNKYYNKKCLSEGNNSYLNNNNLYNNEEVQTNDINEQLEINNQNNFKYDKKTDNNNAVQNKNLSFNNNKNKFRGGLLHEKNINFNIGQEGKDLKEENNGNKMNGYGFNDTNGNNNSKQKEKNISNNYGYNYNNEIISSPAFNKGEERKSRISELIKGKSSENTNKNSNEK